MVEGKEKYVVSILGLLSSNRSFFVHLFFFINYLYSHTKFHVHSNVHGIRINASLGRNN